MKNVKFDVAATEPATTGTSAPLTIGSFMLMTDRGRSLPVTCGVSAVTPVICHTGNPLTADECCHNLCEGERGGLRVLTPVRALRRTAPAGYQPLHRVDSGIIAHNGTMLAYIGDDRSMRVLTALTSQPATVCGHGDAVVVCLADGTQLRVRRNSAGIYGAETVSETRFAPIQLTAGDESPVTAQVAGRKMTGTYHHNLGPLTASDLSALGSDIADAYTRCMATADAGGCYGQPVLARYRLVDKAGATLYVSPVKLLGAASGFQGLGAVNINSSDALATRDNAVMSIDTWRLQVRVPDIDDSVADEAAALVIEASDMLHPVDPRRGVVVAISSSDSSRVRLATRITGADRRDVTAVAMTAALASSSRTFTEVARFDNPYGGGMGTAGSIITLTAPTGINRDPGECIDAARRTARDARRDIRDMIAGRCRAPHRFVAAGVNADSDMAIWHEPSYMYALPGDICDYLNSSPAGGTARWRAYVSVTLAGGERVVRAGEGRGAMPVTLSPLITYPCGDARSMTVSVTDGTRTLSLTLPLQRVAGLDMAAWMSADGKPVTITAAAETFSVPPTVRNLHPCRGVLLIADGARPGEPVSSVMISGSGIRDVAADVPGTSMWDRTRSRRRIICDDGVYMLSVSSDRKATGLRRLYAGALTAWCVSGRGAMYGITANRRLITIGERGCTQLPFVPDCDVSMMICDSRDDNLIMLTATGVAVIYDASRQLLRTRDINGMPATALHTPGRGTLYASTADGLYDMLSDAGSLPRGTAWRWSHCVTPDTALRPVSLTADIHGHDVQCTCALHAMPSAGTLSELTVMRWNIAGALTAPHSLPTVSPLLWRLRISIGHH